MATGKSRAKAKATNEHLIEIKEQYRAAGQSWPPTLRDIVKWALDIGHLTGARQAAENYYVDRFQQAFREEHFTDEHGNRVRAMHAAQLDLDYKWEDIRDPPSPQRAKHFEAAFQARRKQIVDDCHQLHIDVEYYNRHHQPARQLRIPFDFTDDVAELEALAKERSLAA